MLEHDRVFLRDFLNLTHKHHMMTVEALLQAGSDGHRLAARVLQRSEPSLGPVQAEELAIATNEAARFQRVMFAKIFAEFVGALEDFGALCHSIRVRSKRGVLREFLACETVHAANFYDLALAPGLPDLGELLQLPALSVIRPRFAPADFTTVEQHFRTGAAFIRQLAAVYREPPTDGQTGALTPLRPDWPVCLHILLDISGDRRGARGLFAWVFNKLKHRFAVLESVEAYAVLSIASDFVVATAESDNSHVQHLVDATRNACMGAAEIAATLLFLDEHNALDSAT